MANLKPTALSFVPTSASAFKDSKSHYQTLDGLRGIAAVTVVAFHILETFSFGDHTSQIINHGYLAVDFFFLLSGFVVGYAYDDRWQKMSVGEFFKRRFIRLHPMIIFGMIVGALLFYLQDCAFFPGISEVPVGTLMMVMLIGFTLIPVPPALDIRGWSEMHPLNGPAWSLFFEYVANILYALILRKVSTTTLAILVFIAAVALVHFGVTSPAGDLIGGWSLEPAQLRIGFTRLLFPFLAGLLLSRLPRPENIKNTFGWCSILLLIVLTMPRIGSNEQLWLNGLYDSLVIIFVFPMIVLMGAGSAPGTPTRLNKFLGDISYPIYIIHYPFIYVFMAWVSNSGISLEQSTSKVMVAAVSLLLLMIFLAYLAVKIYDEPVRKWLARITGLEKRSL